MGEWRKPCAMRDAFKRGDDKYEGAPCRRCGHRLRKMRSGSCVHCLKEGAVQKILIELLAAGRVVALENQDGEVMWGLAEWPIERWWKP